MKTTVVIPNYNGKKYLNNCLESLRQAEKGKYAVIVVDNGSDDGSMEAARERFPWVRFIVFPENRGFSAAVNAGIRVAKTPYIFLLNNDTTVEQDCIAVLERRMEQEKDIFSLSACMLNMEKPEILDGAGDLYCALGWACAIGKGQAPIHYSVRTNVFSACAGAAIYRKEYFKYTGLFDELHFVYLEDVDLGYRARIYGYRNAYEPGAIVYHAGSGSSGSQYNAFKIRYSSRNSIYLIYKNMPLFQVVLNTPFLGMGFLIKFLFFAGKGYGTLYLKGLCSGLALCRTPEAGTHKVRFKTFRLKNYIKIQLELWINMLAVCGIHFTGRTGLRKD